VTRPRMPARAAPLASDTQRSRARVWFSDEAEFRQLCGDAVSLATTESEESFAHDMMSRANLYGLNMMLSEKQMRWLCEIADWVLPRVRA
jgi:hypothetical protein